MNAPQSLREVVEDALPGSHVDVIKKTGLGRTTVWRWLKDLHGKRESHIVSWQRTPHGGPFVPVYAKGQGTDAKCTLKPLTEKQKSARHRKAARKDGRWDFRKAAVRARHAANRANYTKDPLMAALYGKAA